MFIKKQYMRDEKRNKIGVMVAIKKEDTMYLGFSKCNTKLDHFDKNIGTQMAIGRAKKYFDSSFSQISAMLPDSALRQVAEFVNSTIERNPSATYPVWALRIASLSW